MLDLDATDDPLHGHQEGRFFHGYYDCYCYLPLYVFCGRHLLAAKLRRSNIDASAGAARGGRAHRRPDPRALAAGEDRAARRYGLCPRRADDAGARRNGVDYVFGLARNARLVGAIADELAAAEAESRDRAARRAASTTSLGARSTAGAARAGSSPRPSTCPRARTRASSSPRSPAAEIDARTLYEEVYCARGEMENRIKEQQLDLFADRTSAATMRANQLRLWFASFAYVLLEALRRIGLRHTQFATATCGTIRLKLLKIGALVRTSVRRIKVAMASACPYQTEYHLAYLYLRRAAAF